MRRCVSCFTRRESAIIRPRQPGAYPESPIMSTDRRRSPVDLLIVLDSAGRVMTANSAVLDVTGRTAADVRGAAWVESLAPAGQQQAAREAFADAQISPIQRE